MTQHQFDDIIQWQNETFPDSNALSKLAHMAEELNELHHDLVTHNPQRRLEFADCFILLFGSASADGMSYWDICNAIAEKMIINKERKWGTPDANGVVKHIDQQ